MLVANKDSARCIGVRLESSVRSPKRLGAAAGQSDLQEEPMRAAMCRPRRMLLDPKAKDSAWARLESGSASVEAHKVSALTRSRLESGREGLESGRNDRLLDA